MKKVVLLAVAGLLATVAGAQSLQPASQGVPANKSRKAVPTANTNSWHANAKTTTATIIASDTFKSTSISSGQWTATGNTGTDSWTIRTTGTNYIGAINSTTAAGGFLGYDANSIAINHPGTTKQYGFVTSPSYNCSGRSYVGVQFESYFRRLADTTFVDVSTDNFSTFTRFDVFPNNVIGGNSDTRNPELININISTPAANSSNVRIRFVYAGGYTGAGTGGSGGTYGWNIDDFKLLALDAVDAAITRSGIVMSLGANYGNTPAGTVYSYFIDTNAFYPVVRTANFGGTGIGNATVSYNISRGGSSVNSNSLGVTLPINGYDSATDFKQGFKTSVVGQYLTSFNVAATNDGTAANNVDTAVFTISDSSYCVHQGFIESTKRQNPYFAEAGWYLHSKTSTTSFNNYVGSLFEVPAGSKKDTITSVHVCMHRITDPGAVVQVELYKFNATTNKYTYKGKTFAKTLAASDISTINPTTLVYTTFQVNIGTLKNYIIADSGLWAAVVTQTNPSTTIGAAVVTCTPGAPSSIIGKYCIIDTATGTAGSFGQNLGTGTQNRTEGEPAGVVVNFGPQKAKVDTVVAVNNIAGISIGNAYPNPANTVVNVTVATITGAQVTVSLSNMMGQMVQTKSLGNMAAGTAKTAEFNTSGLASGVYFYTVEANGGRVTNRVVVAH